MALLREEQAKEARVIVEDFLAWLATYGYTIRRQRNASSLWAPRKVVQWHPGLIDEFLGVTEEELTKERNETPVE